MAREKKSASSPRKKLLETARKHEDALRGAGLPATVLERFDAALKGEGGAVVTPAAQTLVREIQREAGEVQAAIRKEFPGNASFHAVFKAQEPVPETPREVLALGRLVAREAPDYASNLIKYAINAATVKRLSTLCDQLEKELGPADPEAEAAELEQQIREAGRRAFEGKPEASQF